MSTNHCLQSKEKGEMKISVNCMYIYIEHEAESELINL